MSSHRVVRVITRLNVGGPARHAILLNRQLNERGFESQLISGVEAEREGVIKATGLVHTKVPTLKRPVDPVADIRTLHWLTGALRERHPSIVHTHMAKAGALGRIAARRAGVPIIVHTYHGHVLEGYFGKGTTAAISAVERRLARFSDALVAVSETVRDGLLELGIGTQSQWRVIPLGLDLGHLLTLPDDRDRARAALGLSPKGIVVGFVGRLVSIKAPEVFLECVACIARQRPDVSFVIAGDGELRCSVERAASNLGTDRIQFLGWVMDLGALYGALDIVVLTSRNEGTPVTLIEAGAAAKPAVAHGVGGVTDVVRHGETGFILPSNDPDEIAGSVLTLIDDAELRLRMGNAARDWVASKFAASRLVDDVAALYSELLERKRA